MYHYCSNGLYFASEIPFPELVESVGNHYISVKYGSVPHRLDDAFFISSNSQASESAFLLTIEGTARYLVSGNTEVTVERYPGADENTIRLFFLSNVMAVLLHRNNLIALHATTIKVTENTAIIVCGPSGSGKSTLALGFYKSGYEILNDDVSTLFIGEDAMTYVYPGYKQLKLWNNSLAAYNLGTEGMLKLGEERDKYSFHTQRDIDFTPLLVSSIYFIDITDDDEIRTKSLSGIEAFALLKLNTFKFGLIRQLKKIDMHFQLYSSLFDKVPFYKISRPRNAEIGNLVNYFIKELL